MKKMIKCFSLILVVAVSIVCIGCGGGSTAPNGPVAASAIQLGAANAYEHGVTFAAPTGWEQAARQGKIVVKFDNPALDGQSVFVKLPESSPSVQTLKTAEDVKAAELSGEMITVGDYVWMRSTQVSRDPKTEDTFDNLNCKTIQFGKIYTVTVRAYRGQNENADGIMNAVLGGIKFAENTEEQAAEVDIDENTDFNVEL